MTDDGDDWKPEAKDFAANLGWAIVAWQGVEQRCAFLYAALLDSGNFHGAVGSFYSVKGFGQRLEMLRIAARHKLAPFEHAQLRREFSALAKRIEEASTLRNRMAHSEVEEVKTPEGSKFKMHQHMFDFSRVDFSDIEGWQRRVTSTLVEQEAVDGAADSFIRIVTGIDAFERKIKDLNR